MGETSGDYRRTIGKCRIAIGILAVAFIILIIALAVVITKKNEADDECAETARQSVCPTNMKAVNTDPPEHLPPFHDLIPAEVDAVKQYLYNNKSLKVVRPSEIRVNSTYIYTIELQPPVKIDTLSYLDGNGAQPPREARAIFFRGSADTPDIQEYIVGPLPNPEYIRPLGGPVSFNYRPLTGPELADAITLLKDELHTKINHILVESYGAGIKDCTGPCLEVKIISAMSPAFSGELNTRKMWFWISQDVEFFSLNPIDLEILMDLTTNDYRIDKVVYHLNAYNSLDELATAYANDGFEKTKITFPTNDDQLFSSLHRRGTAPEASHLNPPEEVEPDGIRYSINGRHLKYLGWDFDLRVSTISGPQLWDIRFNGERIAYEISLQEFAVFYSADNPQHRFADYVDSVGLLGLRSRALVAGADCPNHATFLGASHVFESSDEMVTNARTVCVFEHNTGIPLRRHLSPIGASGKFYEGMADIVFTLRTITTVVNYDYILDFIFHQNGAINVKITSAGYILTSFRFPSEDRFGRQLGDHITGNIHHHLFNFKADLDIKGQTNTFESLDLRVVDVDNTKWSKEPNAKYSQTTIVQEIKKTERAAAIKNNFNAPKYLTFYNDKVRTAHGVPRSYRLMMKGMSHQMIKQGSGQEPSVSWGRYQLAVTKRKESEPRSSSMYAIWDARAPVVDFESFISDDENIENVDQVAWVTMGIHHIPHLEDLPVTPTVALDLSFYLLPYNYFDEDPSMVSRDAIRIDPVDQMDYSKGLNIERYGHKARAQCSPKASTFDEDVNKNPESLFDPYVPGQI